MSISGDRTSLPLYTVNSTQASLANGSVAQPSLRFVSDSDSGMFWDGNLNLAVNGVTALRLNPSASVGANLVGAFNITGNLSCGNLSTNHITGNTLNTSGNVLAGNLAGNTVLCSGFRLLTAPTSGFVLTSNATGVGTWQTLPAASTAIMVNVQRSALASVPTPMTLSVVDIVSTFIQIGSTKSVRTAGWIEFTDSISNTNGSYFELDISDWFSAQGFTITTSKGVVDGGYNGMIRDVSYTITTVGGKCRVTFTNQSGGTWSGGRISFNILTIGT